MAPKNGRGIVRVGAFLVTLKRLRPIPSLIVNKGARLFGASAEWSRRPKRLSHAARMRSSRSGGRGNAETGGEGVRSEMDPSTGSPLNKHSVSGLVPGSQTSEFSTPQSHSGNSASKSSSGMCYWAVECGGVIMERRRVRKCNVQMSAYGYEQTSRGQLASVRFTPVSRH